MFLFKQSFGKDECLNDTKEPLCLIPKTYYAENDDLGIHSTTMPSIPKSIRKKEKDFSRKCYQLFGFHEMSTVKNLQVQEILLFYNKFKLYSQEFKNSPLKIFFKKNIRRTKTFLQE